VIDRQDRFTEPINEEMPWSDITCGQNLNWLVQVQSTRN
jgi:hypothetical protein